MAYKLNFISFGGLFVLMLIAWLLSADRKKFDKKTVIGGLMFQFAMGILVFAVPGSKEVFLHLNTLAINVISGAMEGIKFLFGPLALGPTEEKSIGFILAIQGLALAIFFCGFVGLALLSWDNADAGEIIRKYIQSDNGHKRSGKFMFCGEYICRQ